MNVSAQPSVATPALVTSHPYTATPSRALLRDPDPELGQRPPGNPPTPDPLNTRARQAQGAHWPPPAPPALPSARPPRGSRTRPGRDPSPEQRQPPPWASFHPGLLPPRAPRPPPRSGPRRASAPRYQSAETKRRRPQEVTHLATLAAPRPRAPRGPGRLPPARAPSAGSPGLWRRLPGRGRGPPGPEARSQWCSAETEGAAPRPARTPPSPPPSWASFCQVNTPEPHLLPRGRAQRETGGPRGRPRDGVATGSLGPARTQAGQPGRAGPECAPPTCCASACETPESTSSLHLTAGDSGPE